MVSLIWSFLGMGITYPMGLKAIFSWRSDKGIWRAKQHLGGSHRNTECLLLLIEGKYVNGTTLVVDGGLWLSSPRPLPKDAVRQLSRVVEKRSRDSPEGIPKSKL
ncbi:hypothetical protein Ancab_001663 [Ancistrocladus abbreviatus]